MKKGLFKRVACLALAGVITASTAGCGKGAGNQEVLKNVSFPLKKSASLKVMTKASALSTQNPEEKLIFKRIHDKTNVDIEWTCYVEDQFTDKRNLALSKKNSLPDIVFNADMGNVDLLKYSKQGVIIPVEDLIDKHMPNLKKVLKENPEYKKLITE